MPNKSKEEVYAERQDDYKQEKEAIFREAREAVAANEEKSVNHELSNVLKRFFDFLGHRADWVIFSENHTILVPEHFKNTKEGHQ